MGTLPASGVGDPCCTPFTQITNHLDLLISLHLHLWNNLTYAVQNAWGGSPQISADKRDWLAGAISELITPDPNTLKAQIEDAEDLEEVLAQVMLDEFEVVVDDGTCAEVAGKIWKGRDKILQGDFSELEELRRRWEENKGTKVVFQKVDVDENAQDTDGDESTSLDGPEWNGFSDEDAEMDEAPPLVEAKNEKPPPEVDEDGFTRVVRKKR
jgi:pre-rRNA-processing protein TSR2